MKLQVSNIAKSFGGETVLTNASLQVKNTEKIALVGRNGCGKTTLMKIICGLEDADRGTVAAAAQSRIGYLSQITFANEERTVLEELESVFASVKDLEKQMEEQAALLSMDASEKQLEKYDRLLARFEALGGYDTEHEMRSVFFHFGFEEKDLYRKLSEFSSGQRTRIALVRLLLEKPDLLLLDEPTNHLDVDSIEWLENYIRRYPSAVILVSHDRLFLDRVVDEIVEIENGKTMRWPGSYSQYVQAKKDWIVKNHEAYERQQAEIARLQELIEKFRYKKNKAAFAQSKIKYLERMEKVQDVKEDLSAIKAWFSSGRRGGSRVLNVQQLQIGYDHVLAEVSFELLRGQRMAIVGSNGIGKSTLVKTIVGNLPKIAGEYHFGHQIDIGYFDQDSAQLSSRNTVLDELWEAAPESTQTQIRNTLAAFLFTGEDVFKEVSALSGGERVRLALAKLMMAHDNLLILDEPTNHLDIPAKEALEDALQEFDGTLLFVSHDRMFLKKMADRILELSDTAKVYQETYEGYLEKKAANTLQELQNVSRPAEKKQTYQDAKVLKNRIARLEKLLEKAEEELEDLRDLRFEPEYYQDYRKMEELETQIDEKHNEISAIMKEWEEKMLLIENS